MAKGEQGMPERINGEWGYRNDATAQLENSTSSGFQMFDNYVYIYHTGILVALPTYPQEINDSMSAQWGSTEILGRSAPILSYKNSDSRSMQISLQLHRDMMTCIRYRDSKLNIKKGENSLGDLDDNYIDVLIRELQACAVPRYASEEKMIDPPMVAVRFGDELFIKGVVSGSVGLTYKGAILRTNHYAEVDISFTVKEVDPYDADTIMQVGSFRNVTLERNIWKA